MNPEPTDNTQKDPTSHYTPTAADAPLAFRRTEAPEATPFPSLPPPPRAPYINEAIHSSDTNQSSPAQPSRTESTAAAKAETLLEAPDSPHLISPHPYAALPEHIINSKTSRSSNGIRPFLSALGLLASFVALVWIGSLLLNNFVFQHYFVNGQSMEPALQDGNRVIVNKTIRTGHLIAGTAYIPERGEIVILSSDVSSYTRQLNEEIIKRVIALPGETVIIENGLVTVKNNQRPDGFNVDSELGLNVEATFSENPIDITVPPNSIFVLGDNRAQGGSLDSRAFGPVKTDFIKGQLALRFYPLNEIDRF